MLGGKTGGAESEADDETREAFADACDGVHRARGKFADDGETFDEFVEPFEMRANVAVEIGGGRTGERQAVQ